MTGNGPVFAIMILFGLNLVDQLDRSAFGILLPNIRDDFGLDLQGALSIIALISAIALLLQVPIAHYADRAPRVRLALIGAIAWAMFSIGTGLAFSVWFLVIMRSG